MNQKILVLSIVCLTLVMVTAIIAYAVLRSQETNVEDETTEETAQDNSERKKEETEKIYNEHKQNEAKSQKPKAVEKAASAAPSNSSNNNSSNNSSTQQGGYTEAQLEIQRQTKEQENRLKEERNQIYKEEYHPTQFLRINVDHKYKNILAKNLKVNGTIISSASYTKYLGAKIKVDFLDARGNSITAQYYQISNMIFPGISESFEFNTQGGIPKNTATINYTVVEAYPYKSRMY